MTNGRYVFAFIYFCSTNNFFTVYYLYKSHNNGDKCPLTEKRKRKKGLGDVDNVSWAQVCLFYIFLCFTNYFLQLDLYGNHHHPQQWQGLGAQDALRLDHHPQHHNHHHWHQLTPPPPRRFNVSKNKSTTPTACPMASQKQQQGLGAWDVLRLEHLVCWWHGDDKDTRWMRGYDKEKRPKRRLLGYSMFFFYFFISFTCYWHLFLGIY